MTNNKLFKLFENLDKKARKEFFLYIKSSLFNKNKDLVKLSEFLYKNSLKQNIINISKERIFKFLYPDKKYNDERMRNLFSLLYSHCKKYIVISHIINNKYLYSKTLADILSEMNLSAESDKILDIIEKETINSKYVRGYFGNLSELYRIRTSNNITDGNKNSEINSLNKSSEFFVYNIITEMHELLVDLHVLSNNYNWNYTNSVLYHVSECLNFEKLDYVSEIPEYRNILSIYLNLIRVFNGELNVTSFDKAYETFKANSGLFSRNGKYFLYAALQGACVRLRSKNKTQFSNLLLKIYDDVFSEKLYAINAKEPLEISLFRGAFNLSITSGNYEFAEKLSNEYITLLKPDDRDNMYKFTKSVLCFEKRQYIESLEYLNRIKLDLIGNKYDTRILQMKIYFELGYIEQAYSLISSSGEFTKNNRYLSSKRRADLKIFTRCYKNLLEAKYKQNSRCLDKLSMLVAQNDTLESRVWVTEKMKELIKLIKDNLTTKRV